MKTNETQKTETMELISVKAVPLATLAVLMTTAAAQALWSLNDGHIVWRGGWALDDPAAATSKIYTSYGIGANLGVLDLATGEFTEVGPYELPESTGMAATAFGPDGTLYGMVQGFGARGGMSRLVVIDQQSGKATPIGYANTINAIALDFGPDGTAYVAGFEEPAFAMKGDPNLYQIDTATGQLTSVGNTGIDKIMDFAFDSAGTMWATTGNELYVIDRSTGASEHAASITGVDVATNDPNAEIMGIMFDEHDVLYATAFMDGSPLFTIDTITGRATVASQLELFFPHGGALVSKATDRSGKVLYVKADAAGANDGTTWTDAYNELQLALDVAEPGVEIWVAAGTYIPTKQGSRAATFRLKSGVGVYGGFVGTETDRSQREPGANETVLSGDLNGDDVVVAEPLNLIDESTRSDNSYHVVTGSGTDETAVLDGFVITDGNANGPKDSDGGGMTNVGTPAGGRVVDPIPANPTISNCTFMSNLAQRNGGGPDPVTVSYSCVQGGWTGSGTGNIGDNPMLTDTDGPDSILGTPDDDLRLWLGSPCIDVGDDAALPDDIMDLDGDAVITEPIPFDLAGNPRIRGSKVDIGAYEGDAVWPTAAVGNVLPSRR